MFGLLVIALVLIGGLSYWCGSRARKEIEESRRLSVPTVMAVWIVYLGHAGVTAVSAALSIWPARLPRWVSFPLGSTAIVLGTVLLVLGIMTFRSFRRMNGRLTDRLITNGIYRYSRNPQNVGWGLALFGIAVIGESGFALILVLLFWTRFALYVPEEERQLEALFGEQYRDYFDNSHRYFGPSKHKAA